jgi:hypothetical protein
VFAFFTLTAVTKFSSDGSILHKICPPRGANRAARDGPTSSLETTLDKGFVSNVAFDQLHKGI